MRTVTPLSVTVGLLIAGLAAAQVPHPKSHGATPPPRMSNSSAGHATPSPALIVQGGISPQPGCSPQSMGGYAHEASAAIGPKQDDPVGPRPTQGNSPTAMASGASLVSIGPKQDDPVDPHPNGHAASTAVASSQGAVSLGPKQDDPSPPPPADLSKCMPASH
ncbi:hypothetical protein [Cognatilysobacter lacus]|uniref:Uncharacterized protein n=1 Tax=Cognatilysobacter lacus TaxID=1643323 RepID=A0A5D8Z2E5_9GAMM|nr:hypothetical protein [Lysobacter lacus]TZF88253.1 hypothetical protein FW784_10145 [Lysobacter lacus]